MNATKRNKNIFICGPLHHCVWNKRNFFLFALLFKTFSTFEGKKKFTRKSHLGQSSTKSFSCLSKAQLFTLFLSYCTIVLIQTLISLFRYCIPKIFCHSQGWYICITCTNWILLHVAVSYFYSLDWLSV